MVKFKRKDLWIHYYSDHFKEILLIENFLTVQTNINNFNRGFRRNYNWDGSFKFFEKKHRRFRYGFLGMLCEHLSKIDVAYKIENAIKPLQIENICLNDRLKNHQRDAVLEWIKNPYGILKIPTRGGKTFTASEIIRITNFNCTLYVVDNQLLFKQAVEDISEYLGIKKSDIGVIWGEVFKIKKINVASIQTIQSIAMGAKRLIRRVNKKLHSGEIDINDKQKFLSKRKELRNRSNELYLFLSKVDLLIVDECHEFSSNERSDILIRCNNIKGAVFMSATPYPDDDKLKEYKIRSLCGSIFYEVDSKTLKEQKILSDEKIMLIMIDHNNNRNIRLTKESKYSDFEHEVVLKNERRNNCIVNIIQILNSIGLKTLVLFEKVEHGNFVKEITDFEYLHGGIKLEYRLKCLKSFNKRKGGVLLASNIFNKGLTLPSTEILFNAGGGLAKGKITQKKGRVLGVTETKKKALIIDFIDNYEYFNEHSLNRISVYEKDVGIKNIFIFDLADDEFYSDVREFLNNWKD